MFHKIKIESHATAAAVIIIIIMVKIMNNNVEKLLFLSSGKEFSIYLSIYLSIFFRPIVPLRICPKDMTLSNVQVSSGID